jgi:very-short-patch-repair endonuclease
MDPIRHRDADARGFSPDLLRSRWFVHPVEGVAQLASTAGDLPSTCRAVFVMLPPDAVFTHLTSAQLRGWWMPMLDEPLPLIVCTSGEGVHLERRGVYVRRCDIPPGHRQWLDGVPVASAEWTIVELAEHLALLDLVALIDSALHLQHTTIDHIRATMRPGRRGVRVLRRALLLADGRSESWWETMLRLLHDLSGIPVEPQQVVRNAAGVEIARVDLRLRGTNRVAEYDGSDHRDRRQHQGDLRREKSLVRAGLERFGYIATEIIHSPEMILRDAEDAKGLPHLPGRIELWRAEARQASLTLLGRAALSNRLLRFVRTTPPRSSGAM